MSTSAPEFRALENLATGDGFHIRTHTSDKRKTNVLRLFWVANLVADVTERALLSRVLTRATRRHPSIRELNRRLEDLYGASLGSSVMKVGERHVITLRLEFANDHYLPRGESILADCVDLLHQVIAEPRFENGTFVESLVATEKENQRRSIERRLDDKQSYAMQRCIKTMCHDEEFRRDERGSVEDLESIDATQLGDCWQRNSEGAETYVYFSGDVDSETVGQGLVTLASERNGDVVPLSDLPPLRGAEETKRAVDELDVQQSKLILGYRSGTRLGDEMLEALVVANGILGQFSHSKLFLNVRERESLCYSVGSSMEKTHGLLFIASGIDAADEERALEVIQEQVDDLKEGKFDDKDLTATQLAFESRLLMLEDNPEVFMDIDLSWRLAGSQYDHELYKKRIASVTRDAVVEAARRLQLDTIYSLKPTR